MLKYELDEQDAHFVFAKTWPRPIQWGITSAKAIESYKDRLYIAGGDGEVFLLKCNYDGGNSKAINTPFLQFLQQHPNLFPILRILLQLLGLQY